MLGFDPSEFLHQDNFCSLRISKKMLKAARKRRLVNISKITVPKSSASRTYFYTKINIFLEWKSGYLPHTHTHTHTHICMYVCMYECEYMCMWVSVVMFMSLFICTLYLYVYLRVLCVYIYIYICVCVCVYVSMYVIVLWCLSLCLINH